MPWLTRACDQCSLPLPTDSLTCGQCLASPPAFDYCYAPFYYAAPLDFLIKGFKDQARWPHLPFLAAALADYLQHVYQGNHQPWPDMILPVPLHWRRRLGRGFNQTEVLGQSLLRHLGREPGLLPTLPQLHYRRLFRYRATHQQRGASRRERQQNLQGVFGVRGDFKGLHIALLDDVVTTGSTANEINQQLRNAGARQIDVWALARTPLPAA